MAISRTQIDHPLYERLRHFQRKMASGCPVEIGIGLDKLGLILDKTLDSSRYDWCTPANSRTFACTGGAGSHFSFLLQDGVVRGTSPILISIPEALAGISYIVGEDLFDFLCLGCFRGFFALEELGYHLELTLEAYTNPEWQPANNSHVSVGFVPSAQDRRILEFLRQEFGLRPWRDPQRFHNLQKRFADLLEYPPEHPFMMK